MADKRLLHEDEVEEDGAVEACQLSGKACRSMYVVAKLTWSVVEETVVDWATEDAIGVGLNKE